MIMDDPGPAIFEIDPSDEWTVSFTVPDAQEAEGRRTLMWMRCFEFGRFLSFAIWVGERQHLWDEWRRLAERRGAKALSRHLTVIAQADALRTADGECYSFEVCHGATLRIAGDAKIELLARLPDRTLNVIVHDFHAVGLRDAFVTWIAEDDGAPSCVELAVLALLKGRSALSRDLDRLAAELGPQSDRTVH